MYLERKASRNQFFSCDLRKILIFTSFFQSLSEKLSISLAAWVVRIVLECHRKVRTHRYKFILVYTSI